MRDIIKLFFQCVVQIWVIIGVFAVALGVPVIVALGVVKVLSYA